MLRQNERKNELFKENSITKAAFAENIRHAKWQGLPDAALIEAVFAQTLARAMIGESINIQRITLLVLIFIFLPNERAQRRPAELVG